jgi:hypothetical protein
MYYFPALRIQNADDTFLLSRYPWWASGEEAISVRLLLMNMLDSMHALGWELHASVDITAGPGGLGKNAGYVSYQYLRYGPTELIILL